MENKANAITGVISTNCIDYSFYLSDYTFCFLDNVVNSRRSSTLQSIDGFAHATSHDGHKMLLYIGKKDIKVRNTMKFGLGSYIMSTANMIDYDLSYFDGIEFVGGTLSHLKQPNGISIEYESENSSHIKYTEDEQHFSFEVDEMEYDVTIGSSTTDHRDLNEISISNSRIYFKILFGKQQQTSCIYSHYHKLKQLISFLVNRENVGFEEIYLLQRDSMEPAWMKRVGQVFIRNDKKLTEKSLFHNLTFDMMGASLASLLKIFYSPVDRKKSYSLAFHYEDDESAGIIRNETVRQVCSALECELGFIPKITSEESKKIKALSKQLRQVINEHKHGEDKLLDKTYDLIESSMSHWTMSASDQIKALFHMYQREMWVIARSGQRCKDEAIDAFVKYRNDITHGSFRVLNPEIAYTTYLLSCLVYCCVLTRVGVPRETILQWCKDKRIMN